MPSASMQQLDSNGFANVPYSLVVKGTVQDTVNSWKKFCALNKEIKKRFNFPTETNADVPGYELKEKTGATFDIKENFDFTLHQYPAFEEICRDIRDKTATSFLIDLHSLATSMNRLIDSFATDIEKTYGIKGLAEEIMFGQDRRIIRCLHYFGGTEPGDEIAKPHADTSGITLHLYESHPGLEYLGPDGIWKPMPVTDEYTAITANLQMQLRSKGRIKALPHRVVATEETAKYGRYSMVCFIRLMRTPLFNTKGKGRQQDLALGWNRGVSHEQFAEFFEHSPRS